MRREDSLLAAQASRGACLPIAHQQATTLQKKLALFVAAFALMVGCLVAAPQFAHAATTTVGGVTYTYANNTDGSVTIQKIKISNPSAGFEVPTKLDGKIVTQIGMANTKKLEVEGVSSLHLNVPNHTSLEAIYCESSKLAGLNVSGCTALKYLDCAYNNLTALSVMDCNSLVTLRCESNQLKTLRVSNCRNLRFLYCNNNQLTGLILPSGSTALQELDCSYNKLPSLDVSGKEGLDYLRCNNNAIKFISGMGSLKRLTTLFCFNNKLTGIDLS